MFLIGGRVKPRRGKNSNRVKVKESIQIEDKLGVIQILPKRNRKMLFQIDGRGMKISGKEILEMRNLL